MDFFGTSLDYSSDFSLGGNTLGSGLPSFDSQIDLSDLYTPQAYAYGTTSQPVIAEIPKTPAGSGVTVSGVMDAIKTTAASGIDIFKTIAQINQSALSTSAAIKIANAQTDLAKTQQLGALDIAKQNAQSQQLVAGINADATKNAAQTAQTIATIQAQSAIQKAQQAAADSVNGTGGSFTALVKNSNTWILALGAFGLYYMTKKGK